MKSYVSNFATLIKNNYKDGIIKSINISAELIGRTFQGTATWLNFGDYRQRSDVSVKVQPPAKVTIS